MKRTLLILAMALLAASVNGQSLFASGYVKSLLVTSSLPDDRDAFFLNLNRIRTDVRAAVAKRVRVEAWLDTEVLTGSFLKTDEYRDSRRDTTSHLLDLDWTLVQNASVEINQRLFRAFATIEAGPVVWTIGRQRIAWGTGFAWNPTDLLHPFNPGSIELAERSGIDAVHASIALGSLSRAEFVVAAAEHTNDYQYAARGGTNIGEYDVSLMGGLFANRKAVGGDFAGYLGGAGLRGELAWIHPAAKPSYVRAVVNADYTFSPGVYALAEVYHNGHQAAEPGEVFGLGRWYAAFSLSAPLSPLVGVSIYGLMNASDGSALCGPAITVSLAQELELQAAAYVFTGPKSTEFGGQRHAAFATLQWYF